MRDYFNSSSKSFTPTHGWWCAVAILREGAQGAETGERGAREGSKGGEGGGREEGGRKEIEGREKGRK